MKISNIDKLEWKDNLKNSPYRTAFHDPDIIDLFTRSIGGSCVYLHVDYNNKQWLVPMFSGLPWTSCSDYFSTSAVGYGGPLPLHNLISEEDFKDIILIIRELEKWSEKKFEKGTLYPCKLLEHLSIDKLNSIDTSIVELSGTIDNIFDNTITGNSRTAIRKALNSDVIIKEVNSEIELQCAYNLIKDTQLNVGSNYTTSYKLLYDIYSSKNLPIKIIAAISACQIIGCVVFLENDSQSFHWLHGWNRDFAKLCANQLMIWNMIERSHKMGNKLINLGSSHKIEHRIAKERWGSKLYSVPVINRDDL